MLFISQLINEKKIDENSQYLVAIDVSIRTTNWDVEN